MTGTAWQSSRRSDIADHRTMLGTSLKSAHCSPTNHQRSRTSAESPLSGCGVSPRSPAVRYFLAVKEWGNPKFIHAAGVFLSEWHWPFDA